MLKRKININCVSPGFIETEMTKKISEEHRNLLIQKIPSGELGKPEDVANCVAFWPIYQITLQARLFMLMAVCIWLDKYH